MANLKILEDVVASYTNAYGALQIWVTFTVVGPSVCTKYRTEPHSQFFIASARAFATSAIIETYTLVDKRKDVSSLKVFLESAKNKIKNDEYDRLLARMGVIDNNAGKVKRLRHEVMAHKSTDSSMGGVLKDLQLKHAEIYSLLDEIASFIKDVARLGYGKNVQLISGKEYQNVALRILSDIEGVEINVRSPVKDGTNTGGG